MSQSKGQSVSTDHRLKFLLTTEANMSATKQFRPYLSEAYLLRLIELLQQHGDNSALDSNLLGYLETFKFKIARGLKEPVYVLAERVSIEDKLGFGSPKKTEEEKEKEALDKVSALDRNKAIMSPRELLDSYIAKLCTEGIDSFTDAEYAEASALELELDKFNAVFSNVTTEEKENEN